MVLDRGTAPQAHAFGCFDDIGPFVNEALIDLGVGSERAVRDPVGEAISGKHRIKIQDDLGTRHWVSLGSRRGGG